MLSTTRRTLSAAVLLSLAFAPSGGKAALVSGVSSSCSSALAGFLLGNLGNCLSLTSLISVLSSSTTSIVSPLDSYLSTICSSTPCSNTTLSGALTTMESSCATDLANGTEIVTLLYDIVENYAVEYQVACLQYTGNSTRCLTSTLTSIESALDQSITLDYLATLLSGSNETQLTELESLGGGVWCTDCVEAIYDVVIANNASAADSGIAQSVRSDCASTFSNTTYPSDVSNPLTSTTSTATGSATAAATSSTASSGAMSLRACLLGDTGLLWIVGLGIGSLVGAGSMFF